MPSSQILLELRNAAKSYPGNEAGAPVEILKGISLQAGQGSALAIIGPSGSGKSTLLNLLGALDQPTSGQVLFEGRDLSQLKEEELAAFRNRQIGFVFQSHYLLPQCSVWENVLVPTLASAKNSGIAQAEERARRLLARAGLSARISHHPGQLSGGERQRVAVVRALINQPKLLLADEPTGSLDQASARAMAQLLAELNREEGVTLIVVTHSLELARQMQSVYELKNGQLTVLSNHPQMERLQ